MSEQIVNASGVYVAGTFQNPAWIKYTLGMDDSDANKVYEYTTTVIPDRYAFLFLMERIQRTRISMPRYTTLKCQDVESLTASEDTIV